jgi:hypothetical protein
MRFSRRAAPKWPCRSRWTSEQVSSSVEAIRNSFVQHMGRLAPTKRLTPEGSFCHAVSDCANADIRASSSSWRRRSSCGTEQLARLPVVIANRWRSGHLFRRFSGIHAFNIPQYPLFLLADSPAMDCKLDGAARISFRQHVIVKKSILLYSRSSRGVE